MKYPQTPWMDEFEALLGVSEIPGPQNNAKITALFSDAGFGKQDETTAWCAVAENAVLKRSGYKTTGSMMARSFLKYGAKVTEPKFGDIVVFSRGKAPFGHVGNFVRFVGDRVEVINGNVGDKVCYSRFKKATVLGYRRPRPEDRLDYVKPDVTIPNVTATPGPAAGASAGAAASSPPPSVPVTPTAPTYDTSKPLPELVDDLRSNGSRTINGADRAQSLVKRFSYWLFGIGAVSKGVQTTKDAVGDLGQTADNAVSIVTMIGNNLWIVLPVLAFIVAYEMDLIRFSRAADEKRKTA